MKIQKVSNPASKTWHFLKREGPYVWRLNSTGYSASKNEGVSNQEDENGWPSGVITANQKGQESSWGRWVFSIHSTHTHWIPTKCQRVPGPRNMAVSLADGKLYPCGDALLAWRGAQWAKCTEEDSAVFGDERHGDKVGKGHIWDTRGWSGRASPGGYEFGCEFQVWVQTWKGWRS